MGCLPLNARAFASPDSTMPITSAGFDAIMTSDFDSSADHLSLVVEGHVLQLEPSLLRHELRHDQVDVDGGDAPDRQRFFFGGGDELFHGVIRGIRPHDEERVVGGEHAYRGEAQRAPGRIRRERGGHEASARGGDVVGVSFLVVQESPAPGPVAAFHVGRNDVFAVEIVLVQDLDQGAGHDVVASARTERDGPVEGLLRVILRACGLGPTPSVRATTGERERVPSGERAATWFQNLPPRQRSPHLQSPFPPAGGSVFPDPPPALLHLLPGSSYTASDSAGASARQVPFATAASCPFASKMRDSMWDMLLPFLRNRASQRDASVIGRRNLMVVSSVTDTLRNLLQRCPMETSIANAVTPPCSVPCGFFMKSS